MVSYPEIIHKIALQACHRSIIIKEGVINALEELGEPHGDAKILAREIERTVESRIDEYLRSNIGRGILPYYQRSRVQPKRVGPVPQIGNLKWTASMQDILTDMHPDNFELLMGNLLILKECEMAAVTKPKRDGGIDFIGKKNLAGKKPNPLATTGLSFLDGQYLYLFGQAKRYSLKNPVERTEYDALIGAIEGLKGDGGDSTTLQVRSKLTEWGWKRNRLILPVFATTGRYRSELPGHIRDLGHSALDGEQIAQRILQSFIKIRRHTDLNKMLETFIKPRRSNVIILE